MTRTLFEDMSIIKNPPFPIQDYNAFINLFQKQAQVYFDKVYLRYQTKTSDGTIVVKTLTFGEVDRITSNLACKLYETLGKKFTIALLEDHSVYHLIIQLALYKLRIPIMHLSPRNSADAIINLLSQVNADVLLYGVRYEQVKDEVMTKIMAKSDSNILFTQVPEINIELLVQSPLNSKINQILDQNFTSEDLSKIFVILHSSGTTSFPKAVRWSNRFQLYHVQSYYHSQLKRKLHHIIENEQDILVGITPCWHMFGFVSNFNSIINGGSLFYFSQFPPSSKEVIATIKSENITRINAPPYYINQMIHYMKETGDIEPFQKLKSIFSGGAPISKDIDEFITKNKFNFQMLYSMSECSNLMGSDISERRINSNIYFFHHECYKFAYFEQYDEDRFQLIIRAGAPFLASDISLRNNGDYATKDLFIKSPLAKYGYVYVGRTDDILVMANGEKTNPLPMEDIIKTSPLVSHCTVIGEALPCTAALIELDFDAVKTQCLDVVFEKVLEIVSRANESAPNYSTILPEMVKIIPFEKHLPTTDKGTVSRKRAIHQFQEEVDSMYKRLFSRNKKIKTDSNTSLGTNSHLIYTTVMEAIVYVLGAKIVIQEEKSLFKQGLNSLLSIQLRNILSEKFWEVPQDFLYEYSTVKEIVVFFKNNTSINDKIIPKETSETTSDYDYQTTTDILEEYLKRASDDIIRANYKLNEKTEQSVVLLTGSTGSLGSYILYKLLENQKVKKIYALVRPHGNASLIDRIADEFVKRGYSTSNLYDNTKLEVLPMNLENHYLGFSITKYNALRSEVTTILACAWLVDFKHTVTHYKSECLEGLYNLVKFANKPKGVIDLHFVSSVSASSAYFEPFVPEEPLPADPRIALPIGYAQSKYIVEQFFHYLTKEKNMRCFIHRVGQLCGDSTTGVWNSTEMYPLTILGGGLIMKMMPSIDTIINWLPINYAGQAIIDIMLTVVEAVSDKYIFHIVSTKSVPWSFMLETMKKSGISFETVDPESWVRELSQNQVNPAYKLLSFYEKFFRNDLTERLQWKTDVTKSVTTSIVDAPTVNDCFGLYLQQWMEQEPLR